MIFIFQLQRKSCSHFIGIFYNFKQIEARIFLYFFMRFLILIYISKNL